MAHTNLAPHLRADAQKTLQNTLELIVELSKNPLDTATVVAVLS